MKISKFNYSEDSSPKINNNNKIPTKLVLYFSKMQNYNQWLETSNVRFVQI